MQEIHLQNFSGQYCKLWDALYLVLRFWGCNSNSISIWGTLSELIPRTNAAIRLGSSDFGSEPTLLKHLGPVRPVCVWTSGCDHFGPLQFGAFQWGQSEGKSKVPRLVIGLQNRPQPQNQIFDMLYFTKPDHFWSSSGFDSDFIWRGSWLGVGPTWAPCVILIFPSPLHFSVLSRSLSTGGTAEQLGAPAGAGGSGGAAGCGWWPAGEQLGAAGGPLRVHVTQPGQAKSSPLRAYSVGQWPWRAYRSSA